jgi:RimJ/RimL family protein N-acetyltransferase
MTRLETDRLEIRVLSATIAAALSRDRAEASRLLGADLASGWPQPDLFRILGRQAAAPPDVERFGIWVMVERASNTIVGDIGFHGPPDEQGSVEVGYCVDPEHRRRGYATEAGRAIVDWATREPSVRSVRAECDRKNLGSIRTLERIGFRRDGETGGQVSWRLEHPEPKES